MFINRLLGEVLVRDKKSILLLGPRQTGKSTLIETLKPDLTINLAHEATFLEFLRNPSELEQRIKIPQTKVIFIDEVQRLPPLLNTIQVLLDSHKTSLKFYLTGSSARKLRRGQANLLPGRLHMYYLGPLASVECNYSLNLPQSLETGTLPGIYTEEDPLVRIKTLKSYTMIYLKEEIQAEALTRNLEGFSRFLYVAAASAGQYLDYAKLASEAQIPRQSAVRYFEILEDTLIVYRCLSFAKSIRKRLIQHPKFFFFDTGVLNSLLGNFQVSADRLGLIFEHLFFTQLIHSANAKDVEIQITTFRTEHGAEVDFIVEIKNTIWAIELKAKQSLPIHSHDTRGLKKFSEYYGKPHRSMIVYLGHVEKVIENIEVLPWQKALKEMGL